MARKRHRRHYRRRVARAHNPSRRRRRNMSYLARNPSRVRRTRHYRRHRNPTFGFMKSEVWGLAGGAIVAGLGARILPQMVAAQYNVGWTGYAIDAATGFAISRFALRPFGGRNWEVGGYVGTILSVVSRVVSEKFGAGIFNAGMGDADFDLGYYMGEGFPWRGDASQGPYPAFPGGRYLSPAPTPTAATAVQAGQAAAAAAAAPAAAPGNGGASWRGSSRWH